MTNERTIQRSRVPAGYAFVPKGNVFITGTCRRQTQALDKPVYVVIKGKDKQLGIAVPAAIHKEVQTKELATRAARAANVDKRDNTIKTGFEQIVLQEFPRLPRDDLPGILKVALEKGAGKVGRTGTLGDREKAHLAVRAHIRHCHTNYDDILKASSQDSNAVKRKKPRRKTVKSRAERHLARQMVQAQVDTLAAAWGPAEKDSQPSKPSQPLKSPLPGVKRPSARASVTTSRLSRALSPATRKAKAATTTRLSRALSPESRKKKTAMTPRRQRRARSSLAIATEQQRARAEPSAGPLATSSATLPSGSSLPSRPSQAANDPPRRVETIDLTMDDDLVMNSDISPQPKNSSRQPLGKITTQLSRTLATPSRETGTSAEAARLQITRRQKQTVLGLITRLQRDFKTLHTLLKVPESRPIKTSPGPRKDPSSPRECSLWERVQKYAVSINKTLHGAHGFPPILSGEGPSTLSRDVQRLQSAIAGSTLILGVNETPPTVRRPVAKRRASLEAGRRLSQLFQGSAVGDSE